MSESKVEPPSIVINAADEGLSGTADESPDADLKQNEAEKDDRLSTDSAKNVPDSVDIAVTVPTEKGNDTLPTGSVTNKTSASLTVPSVTAPNGSASDRKRHTSKDEELKHLSEDVRFLSANNSFN